MSEHTVSVVITAYNRPDFLRDAIESVLAQTISAKEIIVVDDCSPKPLQPVIDLFGDQIIYHRLEKNSGANVARNKGVSLASGDFIAFLDDDDVWFPEKLERQLATIGEREACLCGARGAINGGVIAKATDEDVLEDDLKIGGWYCGTSGLFVRRSAIEAVPFDVSLSNGQDWDVYVRLSQRMPLAYISDPLFDFRDGDHDRITNKAKHLTVAGLEKRTEVTRKHRDWLGENAYRRRIAVAALAFIWSKSDRVGFIAYSIRNAGIGATATYLFGRILMRLRPKPSVSGQGNVLREEF